MARLIRSGTWVKQTFEEGYRPTPKTVRKWVESGVLPGKIIDDVVYVDALAFDLGGPVFEIPKPIEKPKRREFTIEEMVWGRSKE